MSKELIIFDTDIGGDCDDAGALALLHSLCEKGEAELLAVTACYGSPYVAGCIDAINTFYHRSVPVGINYDRYIGDFKDGDYLGYAKPICEGFDNKYKDGKNIPDTLEVLRKTLAEAEDGSITFVVTGTLSSMARLITSGPDEISPLTGKELVANKIKRTVVMGGRFMGSWPCTIKCGDMDVVAEWNIKGDIKAAQIACEEWVGELVFTSYEIGLWCITLKGITYDENNPHPVALAYKLFPWSPDGRESWDLSAILYAVRPDGGYYYLHPYGKVTVDDEGVTVFEADKNGTHTYLLPREDYDTVRGVIDNIIKDSPYFF